MSLINYTKYKISIDPKSKKIQGLQAGDIVRRQYFDGKNTIYSLMAVLDTGIDKIANENGVLEDSPYFVGALLDGDIPSSDQVLDFARMTNLFNADRSGALYLTASDSEAPYMSVLDKLGTEKSLCIPFLPGNTPSIASKDKYHAILNSNGTYSYQKYLDGAYRVFSINKTSSGNARIKTTFEDTLMIQNVVIISYKIKATRSIASLPFKFGYTDDSKYEAEGTVSVSTAWEYKFHLVRIDQTPRDTRSFTIVLDNAPNSTISVAELNIIKLSDIANFTNANKATIGKIGQIVDPVFGTLKGYGVYSQNLYATQNVGIAGTLTAGDENGFSSTFYAGRIQKNLIRNSLECDFQGTATLLTNENLPARIGNAYKFTTVNMHTLVCREAGWASANKDKIVTFSIWIKGTKDLTVKIYQNTNLIDSFEIEAGWRRYTTTFPVYSTANELTMRFETTEQLIVCSPQLEFGEYATQYQPTDGTLSEDSESYGFWACKGGIGGTIQNPLLRFCDDGSIRSRNDSFIIKSDGTGQFADGRFAWTKDTITLQDVTIRWEDLTQEAQNNLSSKGVRITGRNVFYYDKDGTVDSNITALEAEEINIVPTSRKWEYLSPNGSWISAGSASTSLLLSDTSSIWSQRSNLSIKYTAIVNNKEYYDLISVYKVYNGVDGIRGEDGIGILSIEELYAVSSSKTTPPSGWYGDIPEMTPTNKYLWNKERINFSDGTKKESVQIIGVYGDTGATGNGISSITNYYLATTASSEVTTSTSGWSTNVNSQVISKDKPYLWGYEVIKYTDNTSKTSVPHVIGHFGKDGEIGQPGKDANLLDWVNDWNTNKTEINGNQVITPKIFAGTKNSDGTLTGLALGNLPLKVANPSGGYVTQTINGIYGFNKGKNTWLLDSVGNAQLGADKQYIKYNSFTGKVEFGEDVVLGWGNVDYNGYKDIMDNQIKHTDFKEHTKDETTNIYTFPGITTYGITLSLYVNTWLSITSTSATDSTVSQNCVRFSTNKICNPASLAFKIFSNVNTNMYIKFGASNNNIVTKPLTKNTWTNVEIENFTGMDSSYIYIGFGTAGTFFRTNNSMILTNSETVMEWRLSQADLQSRLTKITSTGIYTGTLEAKQVITAALKADSIQTEDLQAKFITADIINTLELTTKKGTLANWKIEENYLYTGTKQTSNAFSTSGITLYSDGANLAAIRAKNFRIDTDGNAYFSGNLVAATGSFSGAVTATSGKIGGWAINEASITKSNVTLGSDGSITNGTKWKLNNDGSGQLANGKISWTKTGELTINTAIDTSKINATEGTIGGWYIDTNSIYSGTKWNGTSNFTNGITIHNDAIVTYTCIFKKDGSGQLADGKISWERNGSLKLGKWAVTSDNINNGTLSINSAGTIKSLNKWELSQNNGLTMYVEQPIKSQKDNLNYVKLESGAILGNYEATYGSGTIHGTFELNRGNIYSTSGYDELPFLKLETKLKANGSTSSIYNMLISSQRITINDNANHNVGEYWGGSIRLTNTSSNKELNICVGSDYLYGTLYVDSNGYVRSNLI